MWFAADFVICWKLLNSSGGGEQRFTRAVAASYVRYLNGKYGEGTHWIRRVGQTKLPLRRIEGGNG